MTKILQAAYPIGSVAKCKTIPEMDATFAAFGTRESVEACKARMRPGGKAWLTINPGVVDPVARAGTWARKAYDLADRMALISPYTAMGKPLIWLRHPRTLAYLVDIGEMIGERVTPELQAVHGVAIDYCAWQDSQRGKLGLTHSGWLYVDIEERMRVFLAGFGAVPYGLNSYGDSLTQPDPLGCCEVLKFETFMAMNTGRREQGQSRLDAEIDLARSALVRGKAVTFQVCVHDHWDTSERDSHVAACAAIFGGLWRQWPKLVYWSCDTTFGVPLRTPGVAYVPNLLALQWREQVTRLTNASDRTAVYTEARGTWRIEAPETTQEPLRLVAEE